MFEFETFDVRIEESFRNIQNKNRILKNLPSGAIPANGNHGGGDMNLEKISDGKLVSSAREWVTKERQARTALLLSLA